MKQVGDILPNALAKDVARVTKAMSILKLWEQIVGPQLASRSWPDRYDDKGVVWVACTGSAWAQELRLRKETILERLRGLDDPAMFRDIRFGVRELPERPEDSEAEPGVALDPKLSSIREIAEARLKKWGG